MARCKEILSTRRKMINKIIRARLPGVLTRSLLDRHRVAGLFLGGTLFTLFYFLDTFMTRTILHSI